MGNLLDTIIKRIEVPDKVSLSVSDKEMLGDINKNLIEIQELKKVLIEQGISLDEGLGALERGQNTEKLDNISSSINVASDKLLSTLDSFINRMQTMEKSLNKQISGVKIMSGFAIWSSLLGVAVLIAYILGFI